MNITKLKTINEYKQHLINDQQQLSDLLRINHKLTQRISNKSPLYIDGFSWTAQSQSQFLVDLKYSNDHNINFRERLVCKKSKLNNRTRGSIHLFENLYKPSINDKIYITEQASLLYKWLERKYKKIIGSEYLSDSSVISKLKIQLRHFTTKINHQDLTKLTFQDNSFKFVLSFDCLEHIPDYQTALKEIYRVLQPEGKLLLSVPFDVNSLSNLTRASIKNNQIIHHEQPEYHGNPVSKSGSLSFYTFGWQLLSQLKDIGFNDAYIYLYWSEKYAYLGEEQILICAEK